MPKNPAAADPIKEKIDRAEKLSGHVTRIERVLALMETVDAYAAKSAKDEEARYVGFTVEAYVPGADSYGRNKSAEVTDELTVHDVVCAVLPILSARRDAYRAELESIFR